MNKENIYDLSKLDSSSLIDKSKKVVENCYYKSGNFRKNANIYEESDKEEDQTVKKRDLKLNVRYLKKIFEATFRDKEGGSGAKGNFSKVIHLGNDIDELIETIEKGKYNFIMVNYNF